MMPTESRTLRELLIERSTLGDRVFATIDDRSLTFGEIHLRSNAYANALRKLGVEPGDVVSSLMFNSIEHLLVWFGCAKLGAVWAPLNVSLVGRDLEYTLADTGARTLLIDADLHEPFERVRAGASFDHIVLNGEPGAAEELDLLPWSVLDDDDESTPDVEVRGGDPAAITYTGGSTSMPKGVLVPQFYFVATGLRYPEVAETTSEDSHLSIHHLFHSGGQGLGIMGPLVAGIPTVMSRWFSASRYWDRVRKHQATILDPIGSVMMALLRQPPRADDRDHNVRIAVGSATGQMAPVERERFVHRFGIPLLEVYAQTESGPLFVSETVSSKRRGSAGKVGRWADVEIVDSEGLPLRSGEVGEIRVRPRVAGSFMTGYVGKHELTVQAWRQLWHHTGDLGYLDEDGFLYFCGRQAHWMRRRGENVSAYEVEAVVRDFPGIEEAVAVGVPAEIGDEDIKIYVQLTNGVELDEMALITFCERELAYFKVPRYIERVEDFPRITSKRELDRTALRERGIGDAWDRGERRERRPASESTAAAGEV
jgi:crotonobetaine/carnitine-CoA ligase